jgi:hypothetical protein
MIALMRHDVRRSQTLLDINNLKLSATAKELIQKNPDKFREIYGNSFIAGYTDGCSFDVKIEREIGANQTSKQVKFDLDASFNSLISINASVDYDQNKFRLKNNTSDKIEVVYKGQNSSE